MSEPRVPILIRIQRSLKTRLTELARSEHRSLNQEIEFLLERASNEQNAHINKAEQISKPTGRRGT